MYKITLTNDMDAYLEGSPYPMNAIHIDALDDESRNEVIGFAEKNNLDFMVQYVVGEENNG